MIFRELLKAALPHPLPMRRAPGRLALPAWPLAGRLRCLHLKLKYLMHTVTFMTKLKQPWSAHPLLMSRGQSSLLEGHVASHRPSAGRRP